MAEGKDRQLWNYACSIIAKLHNTWLTPPISPEQIHPYSKAKPGPDIELNRKESMAHLKSVYGNGR